MGDAVIGRIVVRHWRDGRAELRKFVACPECDGRGTITITRTITDRNAQYKGAPVPVARKSSRVEECSRCHGVMREDVPVSPADLEHIVEMYNAAIAVKP